MKLKSKPKRKRAPKHIVSFVGRPGYFPLVDFNEWVESHPTEGWCSIEMSIDIGISGVHEKFNLEAEWDERCLNKSKRRNPTDGITKLLKTFHGGGSVYFDISEIPPDETEKLICHVRQARSKNKR